MRGSYVRAAAVRGASRHERRGTPSLPPLLLVLDSVSLRRPPRLVAVTCLYSGESWIMCAAACLCARPACAPAVGAENIRLAPRTPFAVAAWAQASFDTTTRVQHVHNAAPALQRSA
jgi:hypothetical protein